MARILIVEDNPDIAALYQRALLLHEHHLVATAESAMEVLREQSFDLIILDLHLPEKSGLTVLEFIRADPVKKATRVFVISADDLMREECRALGIEAWMTKPIEVDELISTVNRLVAVSATPATLTKVAPTASSNVAESAVSVQKAMPLATNVALPKAPAAETTTSSSKTLTAEARSAENVTTLEEPDRSSKPD